MPPSEDEISHSDDEFGVPEDTMEQERFKRRLIATARSLKKKQQQLQADQDLLTDRWTEVLAAEEYGLERHTKGYPKHKFLPQLEEEPILLAPDKADRPPRGRDKIAYQPEEYQPAPPLQYTTVQGNRQNNQDRSTDHGGAPQHVTMIVMPDTLSTSPAGPNIANQTYSNRVAT